MDKSTDTINVLNIDEWNSVQTGVVSHFKAILQTVGSNNQLNAFAKTLRQAIIYFNENLHEIDRSSCVLGDEFRSTRTHKYKLVHSLDEKSPNAIETIEITTYAPIAFEYMRSAIGITRNDFHSSFSTDELLNFSNTGKSGSQMFKTYDDIYIIKTLRDHEAKYLMRILSGLYLRFVHTSSLITRYVGLYSVKTDLTFLSKIYCVVMLNNLPSILNVNEIYDLKGSSIGRQSSINSPQKRLKSLKDLDFKLFYPHGIRIPHNIYRKLRSTLESDICELRKLMITDFSLILGVDDLKEHAGNIQNKRSNTIQNPKLGISALFTTFNFKKADSESYDDDETKEISISSNIKFMNKYIMKPLNLIACEQQDTFDDELAKSMLGIPGMTHNGQRVILYPFLIDCLQTFDNFKSLQFKIQQLHDPERSNEYSVIHPNDYEKRLLQFLFEQVFIDSKQTLNELLASPIISNQS